MRPRPMSTSREGMQCSAGELREGGAFRIKEKASERASACRAGRPLDGLQLLLASAAADGTVVVVPS